MEPVSLLELLLPVSFGILAGLARLLDPLGAFVAAYFGILIIWTQGVGYFLVLLLFFFFACVFTVMKGKYKKRIGVGEPETGRGVNPVMAKGLLPCFFGVYGDLNLFVGSLSAGLADTLATEVGVLHKSPRLLKGLRPVPPGTRGAVSWLGWLGVLIGSLLVAFCAHILLDASLVIYAVAISAGFLGSLVDSLLGAFMPFLSKYEINVLSTLAGAGVGGLFILAL